MRLLILIVQVAIFLFVLPGLVLGIPLFIVLRSNGVDEFKAFNITFVSALLASIVIYISMA
jgi:hypothetical protein